MEIERLIHALRNKPMSEIEEHCFEAADLLERISKLPGEWGEGARGKHFSGEQVRIFSHCAEQLRATWESADG